jgi:hypothetical protein
MPPHKRAERATEEDVSEVAEQPKIATQPGSTSEGGVLPSAVAVTPEGDIKIPRSDQDALTGLFANIVSGEFAPRYVVVGQTVERDDDGYPKVVEVKTRDSRDELLIVEYKDLRPATTGHR